LVGFAPPFGRPQLFFGALLMLQVPQTGLLGPQAGFCPHEGFGLLQPPDGGQAGAGHEALFVAHGLPHPLEGSGHFGHAGIISCLPQLFDGRPQGILFEIWRNSVSKV
jgi:hypothetical protein